MDVMKLVIIIFIVLVILYFIINAFSKTSNLTKMAEGKTIQTIKASDLKNANNSNNFTYSMWIYVDDWNYNFGKEKSVLDRANSPTVVLGDKPNTLKVLMQYYDKSKNKVKPAGSIGSTKMSAARLAACAACQSGYTCGNSCENCANGMPDELGAAAAALASASTAAGNSVTSINTCLIENVPIQKWVNIIISLYGRTLDIYLDGKLVRTCILPGVPRINNDANIHVTKDGGFSGWTSTFKYWSNASNPQEAYNIYKDGFGGSILGNALSKYRLRFSTVKDNKVTGSFEI
jgi:hypothetical protein